MPSTPPASLQTLSLDVVVEILNYLTPVDIINLRKTCKALHLATFRRITWMQALATLVEENEIHPNTYDIASMSDTQLERAVMFPSRLLELCEKEGNTSLKPKLDRTLVNCLHPDEKAALEENLAHENPLEFEDFCRLVMVPGGRYLLTISQQEYDIEDAYVKLWDLGTGRGDTAVAQHLATIVINPGDIQMAAFALDPDGSGITFAVMILPFSSEIKLYHINFLSPTFEEMVNIEMSFAIGKVFLSDIRIFCVSSRINYDDEFALEPTQVFIFNYVNHRATVICIMAPLRFNLYPYGDYVVFSTGKIIELHAIPPLGETQNMPDTSPYHPIWSVAVSNHMVTPEINDRFTNRHPLRHRVDWKRDPFATLPFYLYFLGEEDSGYIVGFDIDRSWIPLNRDTPTMTPPAVTGLVNAHIIPKYRDKCLWLSDPVQRCNNRLVFPHAQENREKKGIFLMAAPSSRSEEDEHGTGGVRRNWCHLEISDFEFDTFDFCAVTGRACFLTDSGEIRILDYFI